MFLLVKPMDERRTLARLLVTLRLSRADRSEADSGTEDVARVVELFDPGQPFDVGTKASHCAIGVA
jgi:hypothetical protein